MHHFLMVGGVTTNAGVCLVPSPTCACGCRIHPSGCSHRAGSKIHRAYMVLTPFGSVSDAFDWDYVAKGRVWLAGPTSSHDFSNRPWLVCLVQNLRPHRNYYPGHRHHHTPNPQRRVAPPLARATLGVIVARRCLAVGRFDGALTEHDLIDRQARS